MGSKHDIAVTPTDLVGFVPGKPIEGRRSVFGFDLEPAEAIESLQCTTAAGLRVGMVIEIETLTNGLATWDVRPRLSVVVFAVVVRSMNGIRRGTWIVLAFCNNVGDDFGDCHSRSRPAVVFLQVLGSASSA